MLTLAVTEGADSGIDAETLKMTLDTIKEFVAKAMPEERQLELDHDDVCPEDLVRAMCSDELGIQLLFIPEEYGGMGGGAVRRLPGLRADGSHRPRPRHRVLATFLGSDPIFVGRRPPSRSSSWLSRIAEQGLLYRLRRHRAGGRQRPRRAEDRRPTPVCDDGAVVGYRITGRKQWISNGGIADAVHHPGHRARRPSWFVLERGRRRLHPRQAGGQARHPAVQHRGAVPRRRRTCRPTNLVGGVEGQGLVQAQQVFGYTRLMVAAFGLGGGWAALDRAIAYSTERIQARRPAVREAGLHAQADRPARRPAGGRPRLHRGDRRADRRGRAGRRSTPRAPSPSTWPPRPATPPPTPPSRPTAATATPTSTWSRRSSATSASPRSTKAPPRSWR